MANTFKNATFNSNLAADTASPAIVTVASTTPATQTTLIGMTVANVTSGVINVGVKLVSGGSDYWIVKDAPIPTGGSLIPVGGDQKIVMETGDQIKVISNTANSMHVIASYLEIT
jgi:hypothetical protein